MPRKENTNSSELISSIVELVLKFVVALVRLSSLRFQII